MNQSEEAEIFSSSSKENDSFPIGMRVLAVDDDVVCLKVLEGLLLKCGYKVTTAQHAFAALKLLRENKDYYDLVISDVKMPDMDGFKLLEIVVFEMDLPVIMLSVDSEVDTVMKGIKHGACDYLVKPVRLEELKIIWKHVARKLRTKVADDPSVKHDQVTKSEEDPSAKLTRKCKNPRKERDDEVNNSSEDDVSTQKRPRVAWSKELHEKFVDAVKYLGVDRAVPKKILDHMGVSGLTRENVASHLQKYRKALKKNSAEVSQQYQGDVGLSGFGVNPPSSVILSFNGQRLNQNSIDGFRVDGYQNHCNTIPVSHGQGYHIGNTHVAAPWFSHHNILRSQYAPTTQAIQLRSQSFGYTSNPLTGGPLAQSTCKQLSYLPITSRANQRDEYTGYPSQSSWARGTGPGSCLLPQPEYALNQQDIDNLLENTNSKQAVVSGLDTILPSQHDKQQYSAVGAELDLGAQINRDTLDMQRSEHEVLNGISSSELSPHPLEPSSSETNFHLSKCDSADDLHSVLKQFQQ